MRSGKHAAAGDVEREVDAIGRERANPVYDALAVADGVGAQRAQVFVVAGTGGPYPPRAAGHGKLDGRVANPPAAPLTSSVPTVTPSVSSDRVAVSRATGKPAASAKSNGGGIGA